MYLQLTNRMLVVASQVLNMMNTYRQHNDVRVYTGISHRLMAVFFIFKGQYIMTKLFYYLAVDLCLFKWILPVFIVNDNNLKIDLFPWQIFSCLFNDFYSFCIFSFHCLELVIGLVRSFDFPAVAALAPDSICDFNSQLILLHTWSQWNKSHSYVRYTVLPWMTKSVCV